MKDLPKLSFLNYLIRTRKRDLLRIFKRSPPIKREKLEFWNKDWVYIPEPGKAAQSSRCEPPGGSSPLGLWFISHARTQLILRGQQ